MKRFVGLCVSVVALVGGADEAAAGRPAWCGTYQSDAGIYEVNRLKDAEPDDMVRVIAKLRCSEDAELAPQQTKVEQARSTWSKRLSMTDADWADVIPYIDNRDGSYPKVDLTTKSIAQLTPIDQFGAIRDGMQGNRAGGGAFYLTDAMHPQLTEVGRLAFIDWCLKERVEYMYLVHHAACAADIDAWNPAKFSTQLRGDTAHPGEVRMILRLLAYNLDERLKEYKQQRDKLFKDDAEHKRVFEVANKGREDWAKGVGTNAALLELLTTMDSATFAGSRKMFAGCEAKTTEQLVAAVSKIPAKAFSGMADVRDDPFKGFAHQAGPVLVGNPQVNLAANAWAQCHPKTSTGDYLMASLQMVPGVRGPRSAAIGALMAEKFEFDDVNAREMRFPDLREGRPYARTGGSISSAGGVVNTVKPGKEFAIVALQKTSAKRVDCVKSKPTNRITRVYGDGRLEYESICLKSAVVTYDTTWADFKINLAHVPLLKKGVVFSSLHGDAFSDVLAVWPNKTATAPSMVLGAKVK